MNRKLSGSAYRKLSKINKDNVEKSIKNNMKLDVMFQKVQQVDTVHSAASEIIDNDSNEFNDSAKSVNLPLTNQSAVKCSIITGVQDTNLSLETQINNEVNILQAPSSSDLPGADPALWTLNEETRDFICRNGFNQNLDGNFSQSKTQYQYIRQGQFRSHNRYLSKDLFKTTLINGKTYQRDYLDFWTGNIQIKLIIMKIQPCIKPVRLK
ncbi:uncharacterized protein LOC112594860 [Melanaphis sacchari]|uniref:uncharacterized protein LOC112594860 n=1 Tax=Melanaphis sacchari TaxID=742174 RepID=UPI000DC147A8|nr:uncharacterized protein LOC112594860 [Melanaphis sacchari]